MASQRPSEVKNGPFPGSRGLPGAAGCGSGRPCFATPGSCITRDRSGAVPGTPGPTGHNLDTVVEAVDVLPS